MISFWFVSFLNIHLITSASIYMALGMFLALIWKVLYADFVKPEFSIGFSYAWRGLSFYTPNHSSTNRILLVNRSTFVHTSAIILLPFNFPMVSLLPNDVLLLLSGPDMFYILHVLLFTILQKLLSLAQLFHTSYCISCPSKYTHLNYCANCTGPVSVSYPSPALNMHPCPSL